MTGSPHRPRVALETLGCKLNQAETERLARQLAGAGCELVAPDAGADIYLLNTCTVTGTADAKSRHLLRLARRRHPRARLIATGCYAQRAPGELAAIEGVGLVVGNAGKPHLLRLLEANGWLDGPPAPADGAGRRNRAMVRVQEGCTRYCTYCIVPLVRGAEASLPPDEVLAEVKDRLAEGAREVVLTGTEIGAYQHEGLDLKGLLERILAETGVVRLRLSSLQPGEITPGLLGLWDDGRLCRHFHLSLQSGSDGVLGRMQRSYTAGDYRRAVAFIGSRLPEVAVTTDVIVGFPGETAAEFEESFDFCRQTGFARIHVFPYSPRPGTAAAGMPGQVAAGVKKARAGRMLALAEESALAFRERFLGRTVAVLWEQPANGLWSGLTDNYLRVYTAATDDLTNAITPVKVEKLWRDGVRGEVVG